MKALVKKAKSGEVPAIRELFDRTLGKPASSVELSHNVDSLAGVMPILEIEIRTPFDTETLLKNPDIARLALSGNLPGVPHERAEQAMRD